MDSKLMINDLRARIDWLLDQYQTPRLLTWLIGEIIKDIVFHTPCPPPCMDLSVWEGQEGSRWRDKVNQITAVKWSKDWPNEAGWYWFYGKPFGAETRYQGLFAVKFLQIPNGKFYGEVGGVIGQYVEQWLAEGVWMKTKTPEIPNGT